MNEREVRHPIAARLFTRIAAKAEERGQDKHRSRLLAGLSGRVAEVGCGHGLNFRHYPATVGEVVAVEPEPHLRRLARDNAAAASLPIEVVDGLGQALPLPDASFDAAVSCLVLCEVPEQAAALAELRRILKPGGELRFYEHVLADEPSLARFQRFADWTFWPRVSGGCHAARETLAAIEGAGFAVDHAERIEFRPTPMMRLTSPRLLGTARSPGSRASAPPA